MREATGSSMLLYIVIIIVGVVMLLFVSILSYAKAYGAKNKIVSALETFEGYNDNSIAEINTNLANMGYTITSNDLCNTTRVKNHLKKIGITNPTNLNSSKNSKYAYCLYQIPTNRGGSYYAVVTFISYNVPVVGNYLVFPVFGQTKIIGIDYNY